MDIERLMNTLDTASGNSTDIYFELYNDYFEDGDEPEEALRVILEYPEEIGDKNDKSPAKISYPEEVRLIGMFEELISGITDRIAGMNLTKNEFYQKLYSAIFRCSSELFPQTKEEKVIALKILSESVGMVPYYQVVDTEKVSREEFNEGMERLLEYRQEAVHMLMHRQFSTTPDEAAQILRITEGITDRKDKITFLTYLIHVLRRYNDQE